MLYLILTALGIIIGVLVTLLLKKKQKQVTINEESTILLEKIRTVCKVITVEGHFSEIYDHNEEKNVYFGLVPQNKRALLIVKAKALIGFDLGQAQIKADLESKTIIINSFPTPEIIALETDIKYYDMKQSRLNKFSSDDLTVLNKKAKEKIESQIQESELFSIAEQKGIEMLNIIKMLSENSNWEMIIEHRLKLD